MNDKMIELEGKISSIVSTINPNFTIVKLKGNIDKQASRLSTFTAKGKIPAPSKGDYIKLKGFWSSDNYGPYFYVSEASNNLSEQENLMLNFLTSGFISGLTVNAARDIIEKYGDNVSTVFTSPDKLLKIKDVGPKRLSTIISSYNENINYFKIFELTKGAMTMHMIKKIVNKYEDKAYNVLSKNPYLLIYDFKGIGFKKADKIALDIGLKETDEKRYCAAITYALNNAETENGDVFLYNDEIEAGALEALFPVSFLKRIFYVTVLNTTIPSDKSTEWDELNIKKMPEKSLLSIINGWNEINPNTGFFKSEKYISDFQLTSEEADAIDTFIAFRNDFKEKLPDLLLKEQEKGNLIIDDCRIYRKESFVKESQIATRIADILSKPFLDGIIKPSRETLISTIARIEKEENHELGDLQIKAVITSLQNMLSVITGGPGRGKTTIVKTIIEAWAAAGNSYNNCILLAPTGRAAQRMTESIGIPSIQAQTVHRFILQNSIVNNCLFIVDEFSMVDMSLMHSLLVPSYSTNGNNGTNNVFVFVGDHNQLPSVGYGSVLKDLINSGVIPTTVLSKCYRSSGSISKNADGILEGNTLKDLLFDEQYIFHKVARENKSTTPDVVLNIYSELRTRYSPKDIAILTCRREETACSAEALNKVIQNKFNPYTNDNNELKVRIGEKTHCFRLHDRVIHLKNENSMKVYRYDKSSDSYYEGLGCFNGETGEVTSVDPIRRCITVTFDDKKRAEYSMEHIHLLALAYAITTHKSQGSEYPAIIHIENSDDFKMARREIYYTATTRPKTECHVVGDPSIINMSLKNSMVRPRNTYLKERIIAEMANAA